VFSVTVFSASAALAWSVVDDGKFFSEEATRSANEKLHALSEQHGYNIKVETIAELPGGETDSVKQMSKSERANFFGHFLAKRAAAERLDLLIFASRDPHYLQVLPHKKLESAGFTITMRDKLASELIAGFHAKKYDEALSAAVTELEQDFTTIHRATATSHASPSLQSPFHAENAIPRQEPEASTSNWFGPGLMIGAVVVGFLLLRRLLSGAGRSYPSGGYPGGGYPAGGPMPGQGMPGPMSGGGGGFMGNMMSGLFGAVAGNWLYDSFLRPSAHAQDYSRSEGGFFGSNASSGAGDNDYSSDSYDTSGGAGGDYDSGGGDMGGGDGGGGDF
jgi:uncharacterized protein